MYEHDVEVITATIWPDGEHVSFTFETSDGEVFHAFEKGGCTLDYLEGLYAEHGDDWANAVVDEIAELSYE